MSAAEKLERPPMTFLDFLDHEVKSDVRHEVWDGQLVAMAGARPEHNDIAGDLITALNNALSDGEYRGRGSDQMVYQPFDEKGVYPDVSIACEPRKFGKDRNGDDRVLLNPVVVVEVLSASTYHRDIGIKMEGYLSIESLRAYVVIDPTTPWVRTVSRTEGGWKLTTVTDLDGALELECLGIAVPLRSFYGSVPLHPQSLIVKAVSDETPDEAGRDA